jgi:hypothetical protein
MSITLPSSALRQCWREQAAIDGTTWEALHHQLCEAWRRIRSRAEPFATGLSSCEAGAGPW